MAIRQITTGPAPLLWSNIDKAFDKINTNFADLYSEISELEVGPISWNIIVDKPTIPTDISQLTDNQGLLVFTVDGGNASSTFVNT